MAGEWVGPKLAPNHEFRNFNHYRFTALFVGNDRGLGANHEIRNITKV